MLSKSVLLSTRFQKIACRMVPAGPLRPPARYALAHGRPSLTPVCVLKTLEQLWCDAGTTRAMEAVRYPGAARL
jgi:hypothetical protein